MSNRSVRRRPSRCGLRARRVPVRPSTTLWVGRDVCRQHLDGDGASQASIAGAIRLSHAAGTEQVLEDVGAEPESRQRGAWALAFTAESHDLGSRAGGGLYSRTREEDGCISDRATAPAVT